MEPLVSVIVVTYNSAVYVLDTLESVKNQTYCNLELIVSDDHSSDETINIVKEWMSLNKQRFVKASMIISPVNTGVPSNCNRGVKEAKGEWIKFIAGDDVLDNKAIESFIEKCKPEYKIVCGYSMGFMNKNNEKLFLSRYPAQKFVKLFNQTYKSQYRLIKFFNYIPAPSVFIKKNILVELGYFNERYHLLEDYPLWIEYMSKKNKIDFLPIVFTYYRKEENSLTSANNYMLNTRYMQCLRLFKKEVIYPQIKFYDFLFWYFEMIIFFHDFIILNIFKNRKTVFSVRVSKVLKSLSTILWLRIYLNRLT